MALTLLYVRQDSAEADLYAGLLVREGYQVFSVISGFTALWFLERETPALVILNHELPDTTGREVAQLIRRRYSSLPIILEATVDQLSEKQLKDVDAYFLKSDSPNLLLRFVNLLLRDRQAAHAGD